MNRVRNLAISISAMVCIAVNFCCSGVVVAQRDRGWQGQARRFGWEVDYDTGRRKARRTGKPLMVVLRCVP